jgi:1,4-alpha-glucan branching enzyme
VQQACRDLNRLYGELPALHDLDFEQQGFEWVDCHDSDQSIISYVRRGRNGSFVLVLLNFTPVLRTGYRVGVPIAGEYAELFNSDAGYYGGSNQGNGSGLLSEPLPWMNQAQSLSLTLPPLGALILQPTNFN